MYKRQVTITSLADLRETAESYFSPEIVDNLFALSPDHYKDFDGVLYATDGGRGSNLYLLDKTVAAEQVDADHWTVTVTFYADSWAFEKPSTTVGYSQAVLDLEHTADGWKFTSFVPSDGLDLEAETVFQFTYDIDTLSLIHIFCMQSVKKRKHRLFSISFSLISFINEQPIQP